MNLAPTSATSATADRVLRFFVISDLHAFDKGLLGPKEVAPSHIDVSDSDSNVMTHPIAALKDLIAREHITTDVLICCGDFCDKAQPSPMRYAWQAVLALQKQLGATELATTAGNHDVDSRHKHNDYDAKGQLQALDPGFPSANPSVSDQFWARHYYVVEGEDYRVLILNSSAFHGEGSNPGPNARVEEFKHGRVSPHTLARLQTFLRTAAPKPINILVCHHHPHRHVDLKTEDYSEMKGGPELLKLLESDAAQWLVIHGHTHQPNISYALGSSSNAPIVFAAGSLAAVLQPSLRARNQCYQITFRLRDIDRFGTVGTFKAWEWSTGEGWSPTSGTAGIPASGGFGYHPNLPTLMAKVVDQIRGRVLWSEAIALIPELAFLVPKDLATLVARMKQSGFGVSYDEFGVVRELEKL